MISGPGGLSLAKAVPRRSARPLLLSAVALFLVSAQPVLGQATVSNLPTWQSSPVLTKFLEELRAPGKITVALPDGTRTFAGSTKVADHYTIDINEFKDVLHPQLPATTLWGYNPTLALGVGAGAPVVQSHLGGIIIAQRGKPTQITFRNNLPDKHILPVDTSIQGTGVDLTGKPITENRTSTHLHGGLVPWISDGGPFAFWDRTGNKGISMVSNGVLNPTAAPNEAEYYYPNDQSARLMWYHDHAMGITRLNAYAGMATAYIIRDKFEALLVKYFGLPGFVENGGRELPLVFQDKVFQNGNLPTNPDRPFPGAAQGLGNLWYPYDYEEKWGNLDAPTAPLVSVVPEAFGDTMLVNGTAFPKATVDPRRYRFRVLDACNARVLNLQLYEDNGSGLPDFTKPGPSWIVIGTEGGFLARPVVVPSARLNTLTDPAGGRFVLPEAPGGSLIISPGERFDVVVDFNGKGGKKYILFNDAPGPYPNGSPDNDYPNALGIGDTSVLMRFEVKADSPAIAADTPSLLRATTPLAGLDLGIDPPLAGRLPSTPSFFLSWLTASTAPLPIPTRPGITVRQLTLNEGEDGNKRLIQMLGTNIATKPGEFGRPYFDPADLAGSVATETPTNGATEVWQIANLTADTHPIHFHLSNAQILSRRPFDTNAYMLTPVGQPAVPVYFPTIPARGPEATELGWKETVKMHPGEVTTVIMRFTLPKVPFTVPVSPRTGGHEYVWHCHILEHEEHDMMRTLVVK
ncbi:MAG: multicopper oxidase domain-containing protein [Holophagaceae bacterium]|uniref:Multicopper oxidase domain-containing protein n=1 Tax=Candidatus Geothrix skivensis TaxID=2954439 RepID=A0A9D7XFF1_9BACT|nr:multicopper oxidase domain-containing protein [Candidatus Geothrix skivensis]